MIGYAEQCTEASSSFLQIGTEEGDGRARMRFITTFASIKAVISKIPYAYLGATVAPIQLKLVVGVVKMAKIRDARSSSGCGRANTGEPRIASI